MANAYYWSTPYGNGYTPATVQALGAEFHAAMVAAGLSPTADTGQVNWATVTVPGSANALIGYELWSILGGALVLRIEWYTPNSLSSTYSARHIYTIGTGSNGSGTITGTIYTSSLETSTIKYASGNKASFISNPASGDFFGLIYKLDGVTGAGSYNPSAMALAVEKTVDGDGASDGVGYAITCMNDAGGSSGNASALVALWDITTSTLYGPSQYFCIVPGAMTTSIVGLDKQVFTHQAYGPRVRNTIGVCTVIASEAPANTTFNACVVGNPVTAQRGYVSVGYGFGGSHGGGTSATYSCAMLWEP